VILGYLNAKILGIPPLTFSAAVYFSYKWSDIAIYRSLKVLFLVGFFFFFTLPKLKGCIRDFRPKQKWSHSSNLS